MVLFIFSLGAKMFVCFLAIAKEMNDERSKLLDPDFKNIILKVRNLNMKMNV